MISLSPTTLQRLLALKSYSSWTPTYSAASGGLGSITTNEAKYVLHGNEFEFVIDFTVVNIGTAAGDIRFTLPLASSQTNTFWGRNMTTGALTQASVLNGSYLCVLWTYTGGMPATTGSRFSVRGRTLQL